MIAWQLVHQATNKAASAIGIVGERQAAYWFPSQSFSGMMVADGCIRAVVKAWPTNSPPDYMVVNLTAPTNTVRFYESAALLPGGFANLEYKTTKLVMRKIPAAGVVWRMGSPTGVGMSYVLRCTCSRYHRTVE